MASLTIKNLPEPLYEQLKLSANLHRRSINSEIIYCLESILLPRKTSVDEQLDAARKLRQQIKAASLDPADIDAAKNSGRA